MMPGTGYSLTCFLISSPRHLISLINSPAGSGEQGTGEKIKYRHDLPGEQAVPENRQRSQIKDIPDIQKRKGQPAKELGEDPVLCGHFA